MANNIVVSNIEKLKSPWAIITGAGGAIGALNDLLTPLNNVHPYFSIILVSTLGLLVILTLFGYQAQVYIKSLDHEKLSAQQSTKKFTFKNIFSHLTLRKTVGQVVLLVVITFGLTICSKQFGGESGYLADNFEVIKEFQENIGLIHKNVEVIKQIVQDTNTTLHDLKGKVDNVKKETSSDPRKELANQGIQWTRDNFKTAVHRLDSLTIDLFLQGGMHGRDIEVALNSSFENTGIRFIEFLYLTGQLDNIEVQNILFDFNNYSYDIFDSMLELGANYCDMGLVRKSLSFGANVTKLDINFLRELLHNDKCQPNDRLNTIISLLELGVPIRSNLASTLTYYNDLGTIPYNSDVDPDTLRQATILAVKISHDIQSESVNTINKHVELTDLSYVFDNLRELTYKIENIGDKDILSFDIYVKCTGRSFSDTIPFRKNISVGDHVIILYRHSSSTDKHPNSSYAGIDYCNSYISMLKLSDNEIFTRR